MEMRHKNEPTYLVHGEGYVEMSCRYRSRAAKFVLRVKLFEVNFGHSKMFHPSVLPNITEELLACSRAVEFGKLVAVDCMKVVNLPEATQVVSMDW